MPCVCDSLDDDNPPWDTSDTDGVIRGGTPGQTMPVDGLEWDD